MWAALSEPRTPRSYKNFQVLEGGAERLRKKAFARCTALLLAACLALAGTALAAEIPTVTAVPAADDPAEVSVRVSGNPGLAAWLFELSWDTSALPLAAPEDEAVEVGDSFRAGTLLVKQTDTGLRVAWYCVQDVKADGELFRFRVKPAASASGAYPVTVTCSAENTINVREEPVEVRTAGGVLTVSAGGGTDSSGTSGGAGTSGNSGGGQRPVESQTPTEPVQSGQAENPFRDVPEGAYYHDAVLWALRSGVTGGTAPDTFSPGAACTRAQTVTFLWRTAGSPEPSVADCAFTDVDRNSYYAKAVLWAAENGITGGTSASTFSPEARVTRAQAVTFLWRAAGSVRSEGNNPFTDVAPGQYYSDAVQWAVTNGITCGTTATAFSPESGCTRGQIVTFLCRAAINSKGEKRV